MKLILIALTLCAAPVTAMAAIPSAPAFELLGLDQVVERRSHHCPKGAVVISTRCGGV